MHNLVQFPTISLGHVLFVVSMGALGVLLTSVAWSQHRTPTYKDGLIGTLAISFEALGVELLRQDIGIVAPLAVGLVLALAVRFLPEEVDGLAVTLPIKDLRGRAAASMLFVLFFFIGVIVLLLSYRGWWGIIIEAP